MEKKILIEGVKLLGGGKLGERIRIYFYFGNYVIIKIVKNYDVYFWLKFLIKGY